MMVPAKVRCPKGHLNPADHKYCGECRAEIGTQPPKPTQAKVRCPDDHANPADHKYCGKCGKPIPKSWLERWENHSEKPLAIVALIFLAGYSVEVLARPHGMAHTVVSTVQTVTWAVFAVDYVGRLAIAGNDRRRWFFRHLFDLAIVALPLLRPLRLLRLVVLVGALQKAVGSAIRGKVIVYAVFGTVLLVYVASLAVLEAERDHNQEFKTFVDGLWWSFATITTVGYGDKVPVTLTGRFMAVLLMIGAIGLVGSITATFASWIVRRVADEDTANSAVTRAATAADITELHDEITQLADEQRRHGLALERFSTNGDSNQGSPLRSTSDDPPPARQSASIEP